VFIEAAGWTSCCSSAEIGVSFRSELGQSEMSPISDFLSNGVPRRNSA
jgi:hypothetical protein